MDSSWQSQLKDSKSRLQHWNAQRVAAHKAIVSVASPVLRDKLKAARGDQPKVTLADIDPEVFQMMLKYIYIDSVDFDSNTVYELATAAKAYQMPHLLKACFDHIDANLTTKNVLQAYSLAFNYSESAELKKKCEEFIETNTKTVLSDSSFEEACLDVVVSVFSLEHLDVDSELDLLTAADRYAQHVSKCEDADGGTLGVRGILEKIRFLSLTPEEFAKGRATTTVLSASDACAILANIVYDKSGVPMPSGFSMRKDPRKKMNVTAIEPLPEIKFHFPVLDVANLIHKNEKAWSSIFKVHNLKWRIGVQTESRESVKYLGIYAYKIREDVSDTWSCNAEVEFSLLRVDKGEPIHFNFKQLFTKDSPNWGKDKFVEASKLLDPANHYINKDGAITILISIKIVPES
ncbi:hypothetical protein ABMA27_007771 [Loxostege sticticalis]|uniref:Uncharacterized protein n=1 Tax=Loxostege sticticalis TaxID=481309 RepID=A0ABR3HCT5_LOXSC